MLDRKYIVEHADDVKQNCVHRGVNADVDQLVELEIAPAPHSLKPLITCTQF